MSEHSNGQAREPRTRTFNPAEHLIQLKSRDGAKDYLPVQWRLVWFREQCPHGTIDTEELELDLDREVEEEAFVWNSEKRRSEKIIKRARGYARYRAVVTDGMGGRATGTKSENAASFPDFAEKAETGAIGRALAALGYGTQFAPDMDEAHRIVDSPVDRQGQAANGNGFGATARHSVASTEQHANGSGSAREPQPQSADSEAQGTITEQQLASIRKLCDYLGKPLPENADALSFLEARRVLQQLTAEYKEVKRKAS
ncbi:MAG TPA: hypothetical protein VKX46_19040 [Ktedonobacteraceae bacterium]|nr:hypothetical protein [Ktedonobacteraceae bacterium]